MLLWLAGNFSLLQASADLVAHFAIDEGSGTNVSSSVGGWTGPFSGDPQWVTADLAGVPSGTSAALHFDGMGDRIITDFAGIAGSGDRTVAFWVKASTILDAGIVAWGDSNMRCCAGREFLRTALLLTP